MLDSPFPGPSPLPIGPKRAGVASSLPRPPPAPVDINICKGGVVRLIPGRQAGVGVTLFFDMFIISVAILAQVSLIRALCAAVLPLCLFGVRNHGGFDRE